METLAYMHLHAAYEQATGIEYQLPELQMNWKQLPSSAWLSLLGITILTGSLWVAAPASAVRVNTPRGGCLNARYGPGTTYGIYTCVSDGANLKSVVRRSGSWLQLSSGRWVYGPYTTASGGSGGGGGGGGGGGYTGGSADVKVSTNGGRLNVRSGPGSNYSVINRLNNGRVVRANSLRNGWVALNTGGWASANYLVTVSRPNNGDNPPNNDSRYETRRRELQRSFENEFVGQDIETVENRLNQRGFNPVDNRRGQISFRADRGTYQVTFYYSSRTFAVTSVRVT